MCIYIWYMCNVINSHDGCPDAPVVQLAAGSPWFVAAASGVAAAGWNEGIHCL